MFINELTKYQKSRFNLNSTCKICGKEIKNESFQMIKKRMGRSKCYSFMHDSCCFDAQKKLDYDREDISIYNITHNVKESNYNPLLDEFNFHS